MTNPYTLPNLVYWWPRSWSHIHLHAECPVAFADDPAAFGEQRMRSGTPARAIRLGLAPCETCVDWFLVARLGGAQANDAREEDLVERRAKRSLRELREDLLAGRITGHRRHRPA